MRCFLRATLVLSAAGLIGCAPPPPAAVSPAQPTFNPLLPTPVLVQDLHPSPDRPETIVGEWTASLKERGSRAPVQISIARREDQSTLTTTYWRSDTSIEGLPAGGSAGTVHFGLSRSAGTLTFDGASDGKNAQGTVRFEPDVAYSSDIRRIYGQVSPDRIFELAVCGFDLAYARTLYDAGYRFALSEALALYLGAIPADYALDFRRAGYELTFGDIAHLHHAGVVSGFAAEVRAGGWQLSAEDLILLAHSGVTPDYAVALRQAGAAASVSDLLYLQRNDVSADYARQIASAGYRFDAIGVSKLRQGGIGAEYIIALKKAGYLFTADDLSRLYKGNVDADYAAALVVTGRENLSADDLLSLRQKGLDTEMIRRLRK